MSRRLVSVAVLAALVAVLTAPTTLAYSGQARGRADSPTGTAAGGGAAQTRDPGGPTKPSPPRFTSDETTYQHRSGNLTADLLGGQRLYLDELAAVIAFLLFMGALYASALAAIPVRAGRGIARLVARRRPALAWGAGPGALVVTAPPGAITPPGFWPRRLPGPVRAALAAARLAVDERAVVFAIVSALNLWVGWLLTFRVEYIPGDAISRVANGLNVILSRDPHLGAIGFVWNPLPTLLELPLIALHGVWPELVGHAFAGVIVSSVFGGGTCVLLTLALRDNGVRAPFRWLIVAAFALNPLILVYSANGMSEIMMVFFFVWCSVLYMRWARTRATNTLVLLAVVAAAGTFVRYENWLFAILLGIAVVVTDLRRGGTWREVESHALIYGLPAAAAILFWVGVNGVLLHDPFYFVHSAYSNVAQQDVVTKGGTVAIYSSLKGWPAAGKFVLEEMLNLDPVFMVTGLVLLTGVLFRRGYRRPAVGLTVVTLSGLLLQVYLIHVEQSGLWIRYFITVVPFAYLTAIYALGTIRGWWLRLAMVLPMLVFLLVGNVYTYTTMSDPHFSDEAGVVPALMGDPAALASLNERRTVFEEGADIAQRVAALDTDHKPVLVDSFLGFYVTLQARDPRMFVITSDRDFEPSVNEPTVRHVGYFLVPSPAGTGRLDRVNRLYPSFWANGQGFGRLVADLGGRNDWRLYRIVAPSGL